MTAALPADTVGRAWTILGTVASPRRAIVDERGMVTATPSGWSLDWWIGADDRWHLPGSEASVRQHLVGDAPVVETAMHIPGGDALHRAYAIHDGDGDPGGDGRELVVVEIENLSPVPFAVALAVRPWNPLGPAPVDTVELDGTTLVVNGRPGVLLPKAPSRAAARAGRAGDVIDCVLAGEAPVSLASTRCADRRATAAVIYPLPHTAVLRVALPIEDSRIESGSTRPSRRHHRPGRVDSTTRIDDRPAATVRPLGAVPSAGQVAKGWEAQTRRGLQATLPDARLGDAVEVSRRFLLLAHGGERLAGWPEPVRPTDWTEAAPVLAALDRWGFGAEAGEVLASLADVGPRRVEAAALVALGEHWGLTHDRALVGDLDGVIAAGVAALAGRRPWPRREIPDPDAQARIDGLRAAARLLAAIDQPAAARDVAGRADALVRRLDTAPATALAPTLEGPAVVDPAGRGLSPRLTLALALDEVASGDRAALDRLAWTLSVASPTHVWPEVVDDRGRASAGAGHDLVAGALFLSVVRALLLDEITTEHGPGLALCSMLDREWAGQNFEVHDAPTAHGLVSYAVRWHGERPALLWELDPWDGSDPAVVLVAPGLDPAWSTTERRGEALLATAPAGVTQSTGLDRPERGASFS